jgi:hypothetical protein
LLEVADGLFAELQFAVFFLFHNKEVICINELRRSVFCLHYHSAYNAAGIIIAAGAYAAGAAAKQVAGFTGIGNGLGANAAVDLLQVAEGLFTEAQFFDLL